MILLAVRTLFAQWHWVSEVQSITLLRLCLTVCCIPLAGGSRAGQGSPQVIIVRGQLLPLPAVTLHWLRRQQQQHHQLMRESSPVATVFRLRAVEWNSLWHELQRLNEVDGRGDDDRFCARVVAGAVAGSSFVSTSGTVLTS